MIKNHKLLSKKISHILRHEPEAYGLTLDNDDWIYVEELLSVLCALKKEWLEISENDLVEMIELSSKQRHEVYNGKIRALYGHSTPDKL